MEKKFQVRKIFSSGEARTQNLLISDFKNSSGCSNFFHSVTRALESEIEFFEKRSTELKIRELNFRLEITSKVLGMMH